MSVMESSAPMESSLVKDVSQHGIRRAMESSLQCKDGESSCKLEAMESSFPHGYPVRLQFNESMESSLEAWKKSGLEYELSMESSKVNVKGVRQLEETRSMKMYRSKLRKRHTVLSRITVESSPAKKDEGVFGTCAAIPNPE